MKDRVAHTREQRQNDDLPVGRGKSHGADRRGHQHGAGDEERAGAVAVNEKPHRRLQQRRSGRHDCHDQAELGKGDVEGLLPGDEHRRQAELIEVRQEVAGAEQQIDPGVATEGEQVGHCRMLL